MRIIYLDSYTYFIELHVALVEIQMNIRARCGAEVHTNVEIRLGGLQLTWDYLTLQPASTYDTVSCKPNSVAGIWGMN